MAPKHSSALDRPSPFIPLSRLAAGALRPPAAPGCHPCCCALDCAAPRCCPCGARAPGLPHSTHLHCHSAPFHSPQHLRLRRTPRSLSLSLAWCSCVTPANPQAQPGRRYRVPLARLSASRSCLASLGLQPALLFAPLRLTHPLTRFIPLCALPSRPAPRPVSFCSPLLTPTSLTRRRRRSARAPLYWPPCVDPRPQVFLTLTTHRPPPRARRRARGRPERTASP